LGLRLRLSRGLRQILSSISRLLSVNIFSFSPSNNLLKSDTSIQGLQVVDLTAVLDPLNLFC
jgi:hypothetical protein